jgi:hypothetical protein
MTGKILLECEGCYWHFPTLTVYKWKDIYDTGLMCKGKYCPECIESLENGQGLANMGAGYSRYSIQCECSKCGGE